MGHLEGIEKELKEYIPKILRPDTRIRRERLITFIIVDEYRPGEFGVWQGPNPGEEDLLEMVGNSNKSCIIRFNNDEDNISNVIWRWKEDRWVRVNE